MAVSGGPLEGAFPLVRGLTKARSRGGPACGNGVEVLGRRLLWLGFRPARCRKELSVTRVFPVPHPARAAASGLAAVALACSLTACASGQDAVTAQFHAPGDG